ncbi:MAG: metallophosphoesterase family protein [Verrucomicrobiota bacterium]
MKVAIVSDIHANLQAWNAALLDIRGRGADRIICLGDIVGYGPDPVKVLESVHSNVDYFALGNHDAVICGKMNPSLFNANARKIIEWTKDKLNRKAINFLKTLPLSVSCEFFRATHGEFSDPASFNYIIDPEDAMPSWEAVEQDLLFVGHTHQPGIFLLGESNIPRRVEAQDFELEEGKRFLVNVGSVGQPRDRQAFAVFCILDTEKRSIFWHRTPFDLDAYRNSLQAAGLPEEASYFLRHDPRRGHVPIRETLNFSPPESSEQAVNGAVEVQDLNILKRSVAKWKALTVAGIAALALVSTLALGAWWKASNSSQTITPPLFSTIPVPSQVNDKNLLSIPDNTVMAGNPVPGWQLYMGDRDLQSISFGTASNEPSAFVFSSSNIKKELALRSKAVRVKPGMRFTVEAMIKKSKDFDGEIAACLTRTKQGKSGRTDEQFLWKKPVWDRGDGWFMAKKTHSEGLPDNVVSVRYEIRGKFQGTVLMKEPALTRRE